MAFWLAIGPVENWERALEAEGLWGVRERYQTTWNKVNKGDTLIFYAMKPVKGVIGQSHIFLTSSMLNHTAMRMAHTLGR